MAFHCFLYHYPEFSGHESMFSEIKSFIYNGEGDASGFGTQGKNPETENLIYDSTEHRHFIRFFVQDEHIGCIVDFFTGLWVGPFSYGIVLAGDPDNVTPSCSGVKYIPFSVHPKSQLKRRIFSVPELGMIQKPRWNEGVLWLPRSARW